MLYSKLNYHNNLMTVISLETNGTYRNAINVNEVKMIESISALFAKKVSNGGTILSIMSTHWSEATPV